MCKLHQPVFEGLESSLPLGLFLLQTADSFVFLSVIRFESLKLDFKIVRSTTHASVETPAFGEIWIGRWRGAEFVHISGIGESRRRGFHQLSTRGSIGGDLSKMRCVSGRSNAVHASEMFIQVLLSRKPFPSMPLAVGDCASKLFLGTAVFAVDFALVSQQPTRVCEALEFGTLSLWATVWTIVLVHVFAMRQF